MQLIPLTEQHLAQIKQIVASQQLPVVDIGAHIRFFGFQQAANKDLMVIGGLELAADGAALLRSVVTLPAYRGRQLGTQFIVALEQYAKMHLHVSAFYLLTTTAAPFFVKLGYQSIDRASVPKAVQQSEEFSTICPASAICMWKAMDG